MYKQGSHVQHRNWSYRQTHNLIVLGKLRWACRLIKASGEWDKPFTVDQMVALVRARDKWLNRARYWPFTWTARYWAWKWAF